MEMLLGEDRMRMKNKKPIKISFLARTSDKVIPRKGKIHTKPVKIAFLKLKGGS